MNKIIAVLLLFCFKCIAGVRNTLIALILYFNNFNLINYSYYR